MRGDRPQCPSPPLTVTQSNYHRAVERWNSLNILHPASTTPTANSLTVALGILISSHMRADRRDMTPRQLKIRAPNRMDPRTPSWEGQFDWHQSRTAGVSYFTHLLRWPLSRSALSATTDASTTQQWDWK